MRPGCLFLNNRYHDPTLGTFISVDPLVAKTGEPYIYASGSPATLSDPTGLCSMISGDLWCGSGNVSLAERCLFGGSSCSSAVTRTSYRTLRHTGAGKAIHSTLDVTFEQDWSKADGFVSQKDLEYGSVREGLGVAWLLGGDMDAAAVVARVATAFVGSEEWSELTGSDDNWFEDAVGEVWDHRRGILIAASIIGGGACIFASGGTATAACTYGAYALAGANVAQSYQDNMTGGERCLGRFIADVGMNAASAGTARAAQVVPGMFTGAANEAVDGGFRVVGGMEMTTSAGIGAIPGCGS